ncbi:MAG: transposase [Flavobacteriaceae bacterium]|nr:transposase [Flavobacteriaceae bacterium]
MPQARKRLVDVSVTPYYHCIGRCVRRAFLCGECHLTGQNYEHRKQWVTDRLAVLSHVFAIDVAAYAVMSNHYHLVLRVNTHQAHELSDEEVIERWGKLFSLPSLITQAQQPNASDAVLKQAEMLIQLWRERLCDISWFMRCLNEHLARKANAEDNCTGRFWEGRFKSQALLDEAAVLTAMAYTDLNPIRAQIATTPEASDHTSIQQRIHQLLKKPKNTSIKLMTLSSSQAQRHTHSIAFSLDDYLELVDWSGRILRDDKRGAILQNTPSIIERLNLHDHGFIECIKRTDNLSGIRAIGSASSLTHFLNHTDNIFIKGKGFSRSLYQHA